MHDGDHLHVFSLEQRESSRKALAREEAGPVLPAAQADAGDVNTLGGCISSRLFGEYHLLVIGKWENHRKNIGKPWDNGDLP